MTKQNGRKGEIENKREEQENADREKNEKERKYQYKFGRHCDEETNPDAVKAHRGAGSSSCKGHAV